MVRNLADDVTILAPGTFWLCEWAPDSKHLIAEAIVGTRIKLLQIDVRTGESSTLADILNAGGDMTASADGRILAFVAEKADSPPDVWSLTTDQPPRHASFPGCTSTIVG